MKLSPACEHQLVRQCLGGCEDSWSRLFDYCHPTMLRQASLWLGPQGECGELAEEVAGRVWLKLVDGRYRRLAKFDPARGVRITTYMVALARQEFLQFQRERRRRVTRELRGAKQAAHRLDQDGEFDIVLREYLGALSAVSELPEGHPSNRFTREHFPEFFEVKGSLNPATLARIVSALSDCHRDSSEEIPSDGGGILDMEQKNDENGSRSGI